MLAFAHDGGSMIPPRDAHIHVSDTLDAHGVFILMQYAMQAVQDERYVIWVDAHADGFMHFKYLARKAGLNLNQRFVHIEAARHIGEQTLASIYEDIQAALQSGPSYSGSKANSLIIIDSVSVLQWCLMGAEQHVQFEMVAWIRALRAMCEHYSSALITRTHADACAINAGCTLDQGDERLFRYILRTADVWVSVNELHSGRAAACDGELGVHALVRPNAARSAMPSDALTPFLMNKYMPANIKFLYRILPDGTGPKQEDGTRAIVRVWPRGTDVI